MKSVGGGCQCGAVRYVMRVERVEKPHVCHCRMCQKATGGTPLSFTYNTPEARIYITLGSLDVPGEITADSPDARAFFAGMTNNQA